MDITAVALAVFSFLTSVAALGWSCYRHKIKEKENFLLTLTTKEVTVSLTGNNTTDSVTYGASMNGKNNTTPSFLGNAQQGGGGILPAAMALEKSNSPLLLSGKRGLPGDERVNGFFDLAKGAMNYTPNSSPNIQAIVHTGINGSSELLSNPTRSLLDPRKIPPITLDPELISSFSSPVISSTISNANNEISNIGSLQVPIYNENLVTPPYLNSDRSNIDITGESTQMTSSIIH